jgi:hypothetical protein
VAEGLQRLRLHPVVGSHHQNGNVGDAGAASAHGGKGLVAGSIQENNAPLLAFEVHVHVVSADALGDPAGFSLGHIGVADGIEQSGFAVIHVAHDGHHRRTWHQMVDVLQIEDLGFLGFGLCLGPTYFVAQLFGHRLGQRLVQNLVDGHPHSFKEEGFDDLGFGYPQAAGQFLHGEAALQEQYLLFWQGFCCGLRSSSFGGGRGPLGALSSRARASCCRGRTIGGGAWRWGAPRV